MSGGGSYNVMRPVPISAMTIVESIELLRVLIWPLVLLTTIILLRRQLGGLFGRVREIEGPGSLKVSLDAAAVEQIIAEGRKENATPGAVAERIVKAVTVLDRREARILRALFDDAGRAINNYQSDYYRPALESLVAKQFVHKVEKGFALTDEGQRVTTEYVLSVLKKMERPASEPEKVPATVPIRAQANHANDPR